MSCKEYWKRKTLIIGEVNSGKTERTLKILRDLIRCRKDPIAVLDLAPEKIRGVGGKLPLSAQEKKRVIFFSPEIVPPRLSGKNEEEINAFARGNCQRIEESLRAIRGKALECLVVNDVSLYLHAGSTKQLMVFVGGISTLVINGYYGHYFGDSILSRREHEQMEILMSYCDPIFFLPALSPISR